MNQCILMAEITQDPQLRYTADQMAVAEMLVQFPGPRPEDPPTPLKVVGWGNLAQEIQERYHAGDRVIIEGRLSMNTIDRPEGFKEKRAELTAQKIHGVGPGGAFESTTTSEATAARPAAMAAPAVPTTAAPRPAAKSAPAAPSSAKTASEPDFDDIPF